MRDYYFRRYLEVSPFSHALWRALEAEVICQFKLKPPVLDIGCGFGEFAGVVFNNLVEVGVDNNKKDLVIAAQRKLYKKLIRADARNLPFKDKEFNTVISISTLEHIPQVEKVFPEVYRILAPGGYFIYSVPTTELNRYLIFPPPKTFWLKIYHWIFRHNYLKPQKQWEKLATKNGFEIIKTQGTLSPLHIKFYQLGLLLASFTQLTRLIFQKRLLISPRIRIALIQRLTRRILHDNNLTNANLVIIARKPK